MAQTSRLPTNDPSIVTLHLISEFVRTARPTLEASRSVLEGYREACTVSSPTALDSNGFANVAEIRQFITNWVIENGLDIERDLRVIKASVDEIEKVTQANRSKHHYANGVRQLVIEIARAGIPDLFHGSPFESHFLDVLIDQTRSQEIELSELSNEISEKLEPKENSSTIEIEYEVRSIIDRHTEATDRRNIRFTFRSPNYTLPLVKARRAAFRELMKIIFENAIKYTGEMVSGETTWIKVEIYENEAGRIQVKVENWGPPIFPDEAKALDPVGRRGSSAQRRSIAGHGYGRARAQELADSIGAEFSIESIGVGSRAKWPKRKNAQTVATVTLPVTRFSNT